MGVAHMPRGAKKGSNNNGGRKLMPLKNKQYTPPEQRKKREKAEKSMEDLKTVRVTPPDYLDDVARKEWMRLIPEIKKLPLKFVDQSLLEQFCVFYSTYVKAHQDILDNGIVVEGARGLQKNPAYPIMSDAARSMRQCGMDLGFTFNSRMQMLIPKGNKKPEDNPFSSGMFGDINA
jgi:P27 family predicted phage terminase small subunit